MRNRREDPALEALRHALTAPASAEELQGEPATLTAYRAVTWDRAPRWRRPAVLATKLGVATAAGVLALSGVATAAYTGSLPDALQDVAHKAIKAPAAHPKTNGVGPDATGPAAYGLCNAFAKEKDDEAKEARKAAERAAEGESPKATPPGQAKKAEKANQGRGHGVAEDKVTGKKGSVAYRNLVQAAGGEDKVEAYCASVPKPSGEPDDTATQSKAPKAEKSAKPTKAPAAPAPKTATAQPTVEPTTTSEATATATPEATTTP